MVLYIFIFHRVLIYLIFHRMLTEDTAELKSVISIPLKALLTHDVGIPFTYVVYSPRAEKSNYLREYLHGTESTFRNCYRYLSIPARMLVAGGMLKLIEH